MEIEAKRILVAAAAALVLMLSSCAGRAPDPVSVSQPQDVTYLCEEIEDEIAANIETIADLQSEDNQKVGQNVTNGILGFVFPPFLAVHGLPRCRRRGLESHGSSQYSPRRLSGPPM